jgi:hypothetical protein
MCGRHARRELPANAHQLIAWSTRRIHEHGLLHRAYIATVNEHETRVANMHAPALNYPEIQRMTLPQTCWQELGTPESPRP